MITISFAKRALSVVALAVSSFSANALALNVDLGTVSPGQTFSQVIQKSVGTFTDTWSFAIAVPTLAGGSVSNLAITIPGFGTVFDISGLSAQLFTSGNVLVQNLDNNPGSSATIKVGSGPFVPGSYHFKLSGIGDGAFGGQYVFAVTTVVPEPETYAMLLAGLGVMGGIAFRRNKSKSG